MVYQPEPLDDDFELEPTDTVDLIERVRGMTGEAQVRVCWRALSDVLMYIYKSSILVGEIDSHAE